MYPAIVIAVAPFKYSLISDDTLNRELKSESCSPSFSTDLCPCLTFISRAIKASTLKITQFQVCVIRSICYH